MSDQIYYSANYCHKVSNKQGICLSVVKMEEMLNVNHTLMIPIHLLQLDPQNL